MFFPVSGVEVNPCTPLIVAFVVSFFTSMAGVSGAFLLLPFQVSFIGYTTPSVSSTNQLYNIIAIPVQKKNSNVPQSARDAHAISIVTSNIKQVVFAYGAKYIRLAHLVFMRFVFL